VDAQKITPRLSIRIARLNGRGAETAARENGVHILTETNYARVLEQQLNMKSVSGGTFMMGGTEKDEQPRRRETVAGFYMGKYEVTEGEYNVFLSATGRRGADNHNSDDVPVSVDWFNAVRYCNWLSEMTGRRPAYTINRDDVTWNQNADGFRLPTEAEWEYACRAGTTTGYSFGDSISTSQANYDGQNRTGLSSSISQGQANRGRVRGRMPVGSLAPNPWGFCDMHGNVWEWCWDAKGMQRAKRGGDYLSWAEYLRSAFRNWSNPRNDAGFRIVSSARTVG
jgi:formylglycine-generating enzyme required for sulfatase activity